MTILLPLLLTLPATADDGFIYPTVSAVGPLNEHQVEVVTAANPADCPKGEYVVKYWVGPDGSVTELLRDDSGGCLVEALMRSTFPATDGCTLVVQRRTFTGGDKTSWRRLNTGYGPIVVRGDQDNYGLLHMLADNEICRDAGGDQVACMEAKIAEAAAAP